ncbi:PstS family phosphate ABC transporter substrate-binding protein [Solibacillus sp. CAU 1738]|uniref:PstS family phosphate ABC transporter substrate-binding protein n=1 Tax=Solibacillus sp. CAU 1738 TaxID=3140363 RepID=UPI0032605B1B
MKKWKYLSQAAILGSALFLAACGSTESKDDATNSKNGAASAETGQAQLTGDVVGDGSSTVAPITEALVEEYAAVQKDVRVSVGVSGTGGGFEKFINGETDFSNASRPIKDTEKEKLVAAGIDYTELAIAYDGLSVVIHPENTWAKNLTVEQLKQLWIEDGTTKKWSDIDPSWPDEEVVFYSPGADSGTFDYFDEVILDGEDLVKTATLSEDDNVLVQGVIADKNAIAFFGYAYYLANESKLQVVSVNGIEPNNETIESGEYSPLSRPLFVYVKNKAMAENEAAYDFIKYSLENAGNMAEAAGYVRLPDVEYEKGLAALEALK